MESDSLAGSGVKLRSGLCHHWGNGANKSADSNGLAGMYVGYDPLTGRSGSACSR